MRRRAAPLLLAAALCATIAAIPDAGFAQARRSTSVERPTATLRQSGPPHAWLFGVWTGGLFPVLDGMLAQDCSTQPTVAFGQDLVGHASLTGTTMTQRIIETVRTSPTGAEFRLSPDATDNGSFGCDDTNVLHVAREDGDTISFPHCTAFPYKLERCPAPGR